MSRSIALRAYAQVAKRHTPGMVVRPVCMLPTNTVGDLYDLKVSEWGAGGWAVVT